MHLASNQEDVGDRNRRVILSEILFHGPVSRSVIAERVGLTAASVSRITRNLIESGIVEEGEHYTDGTRRGRKSIRLRIRPSGGFIAGIAINVFCQDIVIADLANGEVAHKRLRFDTLTDANHVLVESARALNELLEEAGIKLSQVVGCSVVIAGAVDPATGVLQSSPALGWYNLDVRKIISSQLDLAITVESIANAKTLAARYFGPAKSAKNVILTNCSLAVSASLFIDGRLIRGIHASAGLVDEMLIPDESDGSFRPIDHIAGGYGAIGIAPSAETGAATIHANQLVETIAMESQGNPSATKQLHQAGRALGWFIAQTNALLHPEQFLVSGPMIESDAYCEGVRTRLIELVDEEFVSQTLRFYRISSHGAAQSLAVYHFLVGGHHQPRQLELATGS
ncbi:MAG: ROK family transcriptional regulator [Granulosicoccus sp.]|nr:ROK family transcriptional regulator [Granulosicoccus sp.]